MIIRGGDVSAFTESAFGKDEKSWNLASPTTQENGEGLAW